MKLTKAELAVIILTVVFIAVASGYYIGRGNQSADFTITTERRADEAALLTGGDEATPSPSPESGAPAERVDINTASAEELSTLPGIGEVLAGRIVEYRGQNGDFEHIEDIMDVYGIGEAIFDGVSKLICVGADG